MTLTYQQRKEFDKYRAGCDFYWCGICISSPCWCRKFFKEQLKQKDEPDQKVLWMLTKERKK